jgi:dihydrolipoamide dehydrogenase
MVVGEFTQETDLAVLGGGAAGCAAALRAAELGMRPVIVDPGGASPHVGWLHARVLSDAARLIRTAGQAEPAGIRFGAPVLDLGRLRQWAQQIGEALTTQLEQDLTDRGIEVIRGQARFEGARQVQVHDGAALRLRFKQAIIATGSQALPPAGGWPGSPRVTDARGAAELDRLPASMLVIGGGPAAVELACAFAGLGSAVCLAAPDELLPDADPDLVRPFQRRLGHGLEVLVRCPAYTLRPLGDAVEVTFDGPGRGAARRFEHVVLATGEVPRTEGLDLGRASIEVDQSGAIRVDERMTTSNGRVLAVGDVTGGPASAGRAVRQGIVAAEVICGLESAYDGRAVPSVVFADPPLAWCGLTESAAAAEGIAVRACSVPWSSSGRAVSLGQAGGITKVVLDAGSGLVLGAGILGEGAPDMIGEAALAIEMGAVADDLAAVLHPHPTMSDLLAQAARQALDTHPKLQNLDRQSR